MKVNNRTLFLFMLLVACACQAQSNPSPTPGEKSRAHFLQAIYDEDLLRVKQFIEYGADVNGSDKSGLVTPLTVAIDTHNLELVQLLVEEGADINQVGDYRVPPVYFAISEDLQIAEYLIAEGAKVIEPIPTYRGSSFIEHIVFNINEDKTGIQILVWAIRNGVDVNRVAPPGIATALRSVLAGQMYRVAAYLGCNGGKIGDTDAYRLEMHGDKLKIFRRSFKSDKLVVDVDCEEYR